MHGWLNRLNAATLCLLLCLPLAGQAKTVGVTVQAVSADLSAAQPSVDVRMKFQLSSPARQAILHGVPLIWKVTIKCVTPRPILWDKVLLRREIPLRLQYHALLNQFSVQKGARAEAEMFGSLERALAAMARLHIELGEKPAALVNGPVQLSIQVDFVREALPTPLRPDAWLNPQWDLSSDRSLWPLKK